MGGDGLLTITEAARQAQVSRPTLYGWIKRGTLPSVRLGTRRFVRADDIAPALAIAHVDGVVPAWRQDRQRAGQRLRALREAAGMTQLELETTSGVTHEAISRLEKGRGAPYAETVRLLAHALRVDPRRFVSRETGGLTTLTAPEVATQLEVPVGRVQRWLREGTLPATKVSGQWRVLAVVVAEFSRSGRLRGRSRRLDPRYRG